MFLKHFQEHNQTMENIFRNTSKNTTKYLKITSILKNIFTWKYFKDEKYFPSNQTQLTQWGP